MHRLFMMLARAMAMSGGLVLSALIVLTCLSIVGRMLNTAFHGALLQALTPGFAHWALQAGVGPINGDFELVEAGIAFAIFAFLPLCQITGGHATVDIFTSRLSPRADRLLRMVIEVAFAIALVVIALQLYHGMASKMRSGQTTLLLQFPEWWAYAASLSGAVIAAVVAVYVAGVRAVEFFTNRMILADVGESGH
ncbi:MAG: TRAP transporter small permease [Rhizobiaceae bacterium]